MPDIPRLYPALTELFMVTIRQLGEGVKGIKIIWWYVAALDGGVVAGSPGGRRGLLRSSFLWGRQ